PLGLSSGRFPSVFPTLPDPFSVPFPVRISFPVAVGVACRPAVFYFRRSVVSTLSESPPPT
ncbi:hypothetical protein, partial [Streptomyces pactum]|uniref:hypothetical protein n=1 Tax=Streptomyces pactum TaxID=68249 RepID=UPI0036FE627C